MKTFKVRFTYQETTSTKRQEAESTVEAESRDDARDIIIGRWYNPRIRTVTEINPQKALPHSV